MANGTKDGIAFIHSYLVKPRGGDEEYEPMGTPVPLRGDLFNLLNAIYAKSEKECSIEIVFRSSDDGSQSNEVRDLLIEILEASDDSAQAEKAQLLANRLVDFTNGVTGPGLLFVVGGISNGQTKLLISRFPADEGIMADEEGGKLTVEFVDKLFMKDRTSYKAVVFHRLSSVSRRRSGVAVDKQVNDLKNPSSRYWIEDFLHCTLSVTSHAGSERFASALRQVYNLTEDLEKKATLAAAAKLLKKQQGQKKTPLEFLRQFNVDPDLIEAVEKKLGPHAMSETFELNSDVFSGFFRYQSKLLHTGVMITAEVEKYDDVIDEREEGGETVFSTKGRVINSKVQKTRANGAM